MARRAGSECFEVFQQGVHPVLVVRQFLVAVDRAVMASVRVAGLARVELEALGATVVYEPARMSVEQLGRAQMAAFCDFYRPRSAFARLKILPFKKNSWLANLAIYRGLVYYYQYHKKRWTLPSFSEGGSI